MPDFENLGRNLLPREVRDFLNLNEEEDPRRGKPGSIDYIKSAFGVAGHQKASRFRIKFTPPLALTTGGVNTRSGHAYTEQEIAIVEAYSFQTAVPDSTYASYDWVAKGTPIKLPYQKGYSDLNTTHYVDEKGIVRSFFQDWYELIVNTDTNNFEYPENYFGTIIIDQYDRNGMEEKNITASWVMDSVWPITIGIEALSYETTDALLTFTVDWAYNIAQMTKRLR